MKSSLLLLAIPLLAAAAPTSVKRAGSAGAPVPVAIPAGCNIKHTYPSPNNTNFAPVAKVASKALYTYSLNPGSTQPDGTNDQKAVENCLETCYGFGNPGECTSVYTSHGVNVNEYGSVVYAEFVCKLFAKPMKSADLGPPNQGDEDANAHALTIGCGPRKQ